MCACTHTHTHTSNLSKKPLKVYPFFKELMALILPKTPHTEYQGLTIVLSEKDKQFSENIKLKYIQDFMEKKESEEKVVHFREHDSSVQQSKTMDVPKEIFQEIMCPVFQEIRCPQRNPNETHKKFQDNVQELNLPQKTIFPRRIQFHGESKNPFKDRGQIFHEDSWSGLVARISLQETGDWQILPRHPEQSEIAL